MNTYSMLCLLVVVVYFIKNRKARTIMGTHRAADSAVQRRESSKLPAVSYVAFVLVVGGFYV